MMGKLAMVAATGLVGGIALMAVGYGVAGVGWTEARGLWGASASNCRTATAAGREITLPFTPGDSLRIDIPASVTFRPGDKAEAIVRGDPELIAHVRIDGQRLTFDCDPGWGASGIEVALSGPAITEWKMNGSGKLALTDIDQPKLTLSIMGSGSIAATGAADVVSVSIKGSGTARLDDLTAKSAEVSIHGSGDAEVNARSDASVAIYGSGNVEISGRPVMRQSRIMGSGRIVQTD